MVTTTADYTAGDATISVGATVHAYASGAPVVDPYEYTVPATGATDTDATCPPTQAQVDLGLTNCAMAVADLAANEYGFGYVNYSTTATWPASTSVPGSTGLTDPPSLTVTNVSHPSEGSAALPGDTVELTSDTAPNGVFWADPDGSLSEPLTVEVVDHNGTTALLTTTNTSAHNALSIVPDVYYPAGTSPSCPLSCPVTGHGGGGTMTGGMLQAQARVGANPNSTGAALQETIPAEGFDPATGAPTAWATGPLTYLVVEPNVAPASDSPFDTATVTCTYTCPIPGSTGITQIATLSSAVSAGATSLPVSALSGALSAGTPLAVGSPTGTNEQVFVTLPVVSGATTITVTPTVNAYASGAPVMTTTLPDPEGAIGVATGSMPSTPGAPTIGTATPGNTQATVSFSAPTNTGGSSITGYTATATDSTTPANGGQTATGTTSPITVSGLTNGDSYTFTVTATNAAGTGPASSASNAVTPAADLPGAPTIGTAKAANAQATVSFTAPTNTGGSSITGYTVTAADSTTPANGGETGTGTSSPITVTGLTNGDSYTFTVTATNTTGPGAASAASNAVTPSTNPCAAYSGNEAFICSAYEDLLSRAPDSGGLTYWNAKLTGGLSRTVFAYDLTISLEYRTDLVTGYYETFLGRTPESAGLTYWVDQLKAGVNDEAVLAVILGSGQFYTDSGGTSAGFVHALYEDLLGRAPESGGLTYWENQLSSGASRTAVARAILASTEYRGDLVTNDYQTFLGRTPESAGLTYWVDQLKAGLPNEWVIALIVGSPEFYTLATTV
jgi:hypothetical protein